MSIFSKYPKKEKLISRTYEIDFSLYEKLEKLSKEKYEASINKLVNTSLEFLLQTENVNLYIKSKHEISVYRSFLIRESLYNGLNELKEKYNISLNKLINIAIYNALQEEDS